jgi:tRNA pseudouridine55 synthase
VTTAMDARTTARLHLAEGILNVNKPAGWTSHDVVAKMRGLLKGCKVGHAGTLDPSATGVLPILVGRATRIAEYLLDWDKEYHAVLRLGETTDTQDATGAILTNRPTDGVTEDAIRSVLVRFRGRISQVPPMYSAIKVKGVPLYKAARAGRTVPRHPREVTVHRLEMRGVTGRDVSLHIACSKGTYVRTLCADIGEALGVGGHLLNLERRRVGPLTIEQALTIEEISARLLSGRLAEHLIPLDAALDSFPSVVLDERAASRVLHGAPVAVRALQHLAEARSEAVPAGQPLRLKDTAGRLLALGQVSGKGTGAGPADDPDSVVRILKVLVDTEP